MNPSCLTWLKAPWRLKGGARASLELGKACPCTFLLGLVLLSKEPRAVLVLFTWWRLNRHPPWPVPFGVWGMQR